MAWEFPWPFEPEYLRWGITVFLFEWIPEQNRTPFANNLGAVYAWAPDFAMAALPLVILCLLALIPRWARLTDRPIVFATIYSIPYFLFVFQDSLGDSGQVMDGVLNRYYMSEPLATWVHYWFYRVLHTRFDMSAKSAVALSSQVGGFLYLLFIAQVSKQLFPDLSPTRRLVHRLIFFVAPISFLCYGYVENTPLALPGEQLWVLTTLIFFSAPSWRNLSLCAASFAIASALHGRVTFLFPAFALGCFLPSGTLWTRFKRVCFGSAVFAGLIATFVAYIFLVEPQYISAGPVGNITGGGNRKMFVSFHDIISARHLWSQLQALLIGGGFTLVFCLLGLAKLFRGPSQALVWCLGYIAADLIYVFGWEFDYGPFLDWDLVFSAALPLLLLASLGVTRSRIPTFVVLPIIIATGILGHVFATISSGAPMTLNIAPKAHGLTNEPTCASPGLLRTYYTDFNLSTPAGVPESDVPVHVYGVGGIPFPVPGKPLGGIFEGFITIPKEGLYRFVIIGQGNVRLRVGDQSLVDRWFGHEWRMMAEREMTFSKAGRYPIRVEFFSTVSLFGVELYIESAQIARRKVELNDLCYN